MNNTMTTASKFAVIFKGCAGFGIEFHDTCGDAVNNTRWMEMHNWTWWLVQLKSCGGKGFICARSKDALAPQQD